MTDDMLQIHGYPESEHIALPVTVTTGAAQLMTGLSAGLPADRFPCIDCGVELTVGQSVTVYGARLANRPQWELRRWYCTDCAPASIRSPTLGVRELLARSHLGTVTLARRNTERLCLTEVLVVADSPPEESTHARGG